MTKFRTETEDVVTEMDLALAWQVSKRFIQTARNIYGLPYYKIGRLIRFKRQDANKWFEQRKKSA